MGTSQCLICKNQHLLVTRRRDTKTNSGMLVPIGGHIENGETPFEACVREVKEETGLNVVPRYVGIVVNVYEAKPTDFRFVFYAETDEPPQSTAKDPLEWLAIKQLPNAADLPELDRVILPMLLGRKTPLIITLDIKVDGNLFKKTLRSVQDFS